MTTSPKRPPMIVKRDAVAHVQPAGRRDDATAHLRPYVPPAGVAPVDALAMDDATTIYQWASTQYAGYGAAQSFVGFPVLSDLTQRPEYRVITETIARDATRKWCKLVAKGDDQTKADRLKELQEAVDAYGVQDLFRKCCELDGFFGRGHLYIDTGATDDPDELAKPMPVDSRKIGKGKLVRFATVEPMWTYPNDYNSNDPLKPNYYRPQSWFVMGKIVHRDRLITFVSREVPDLLKPSYAFGGISMSQLAMPYVDNWIRTRQSVSDLLHSFSKTILKTNMAGVLTGGGADTLLTRLDLFNRTRDNRGVIAVDMETEDIVDVSTPLSSLDKLQAQSQEQMASVAGIPLVVLLSITPSGLNASSDGELAAYDARIASLQERLFDAPLTKVLQILQLHLWGEIDPEIVHEWLPIGEQDEEQAATTDKTKMDTIVAGVDAGVVSPEEGRAALAADPESIFHGIDLTGPAPELPDGGSEPPGDDGDGGGEEAGPFAADAGGEHWITVHPNGKEDKGRPLLVQSGEGNTVTVKGGAGGKLNGKTLTPGSMSKARGGESDAPKSEPAPPEHETKQAAAHALTEKADKENTEAAHNEAHEAHRAAMLAARERKDGQAALNHAILSQHHQQQAVKAKGREAKTAFSESDLAQRIKQAEKRFEKASVDDLSRHFKDSYGIEFANGTNAVRDYDKARKEHFKGWGQLTPEQKQARTDELNRLGSLAVNSHTRVKGHTSYDLNENTPATKAARRTMAHVADAFDRLQSQGYDLKSAMSGAKVAFTPGNTGKAMGHAWQKNGVGYFAISSGKANNDMRLRLREATEQRAAKGLPRWSVSSSSDDVNTQMTAVHELAHALGMQPHIDSPGKLHALLRTMFNGSMAEQHKWIRENISEYAATNIKETDAELAALVTSPGYVRGTLPRALEDHVDALFHRKP